MNQQPQTSDEPNFKRLVVILRRLIAEQEAEKEKQQAQNTFTNSEDTPHD